MLAGYGQIIGVGSVLVIITYSSIVIGELIPKRIALKNPERTASLIAKPMSLLSRVAAPFVWLLGASTDTLLKLLGLHGEREATVTEEEVRSMITEGTQAGVFDPREKEMIDGVLRLADRTVRAIMTPRPDVVWLDVHDKPEAVIKEIQTSGHSRFPVCRGELDELVGIVQNKDLLSFGFQGKPLNLEAAAVKPMVVHDATPILKLLDLMKRTGMHMAVAVDEYGSVEGIVTLTDVMEHRGRHAGPRRDRRAGGGSAGRWLVAGQRVDAGGRVREPFRDAGVARRRRFPHHRRLCAAPYRPYPDSRRELRARGYAVRSGRYGRAADR